MDLFKLPCFLITLFAKKKKNTVKKSGSNFECFRTGAWLVGLRNRSGFVLSAIYPRLC